MKVKDYIILGAIMFLIMLFLRKCDHVTIENPTQRIINTIVKTDTIVNTIIREVKVKVVDPTIIYIDTNNKVTHDTIYSIPVNQYIDSLVDSNVSIYYEDIVKGTLLSKKLKYKLNKVLTTRTITNDITQYKSLNTLFLTGHLGGNQSQFNNLSLGLLLKTKKDRLIGYHYNFIQNSHNITLGTKLIGR